MAVATRDCEVGVPARESDGSSVVISAGEPKTGLSNSQMKLRCKKKKKEKFSGIMQEECMDLGS